MNLNIIDQVWHLHLIYTHSYWKEFCQNCLEKEIHHSPTKGRNIELDKHYNLYEHISSLYKGIL